MLWLYVNHRKFVEAGPGNMSYVCPDKIGESLCLSVVDEAYCIELTGKTNNFILFHFCCRSVLHIVQNFALLYISLNKNSDHCYRLRSSRAGIFCNCSFSFSFRCIMYVLY